MPAAWSCSSGGWGLPAAAAVSKKRRTPSATAHSSAMGRMSSGPSTRPFSAVATVSSTSGTASDGKLSLRRSTTASASTAAMRARASSSVSASSSSRHAARPASEWARAASSASSSGQSRACWPRARRSISVVKRAEPTAYRGLNPQLEGQTHRREDVGPLRGDAEAVVGEAIGLTVNAEAEVRQLVEPPLEGGARARDTARARGRAQRPRKRAAVFVDATHAGPQDQAKVPRSDAAAHAEDPTRDRLGRAERCVVHVGIEDEHAGAQLDTQTRRALAHGLDAALPARVKSDHLGLGAAREECNRRCGDQTQYESFHSRLLSKERGATRGPRQI